MPRLHVEAAGAPSEEVVDLAESGSSVLGRSPDSSRLAASLKLESPSLHRLPYPSVSSNHVAVWSRDSHVYVRDLGSRNGSWLRLPSEVTLAFPADHDLHLRLGFQPTGTRLERPIDPPRYENPTELGSAMAREVERWCTESGVPLQVTVARADEAAATGAVDMQLASGEMLQIVAARTVDDQFAEMLVTIARYVAAQNALFVAEQQTRGDGMILASTAIRHVHRRTVDAAMRNVNRVLLLGPSGTGKERLARTYHSHLGRSGPLVTVNCATLSRDRIIADLFGAEVGAYTGAQRTVVGAVERADGGTLFLDEIGEMPLEVQSQLLRFLDTGEYQRLGSTGLNRHADVYLVAATNRDLRAMVNTGTFRLDLFFRIALEVIEVPSLRERFKDAISFLASYSLGGVSALDSLDVSALEVLRQHAWSGNFRELLNFAMRLPRGAGVRSITADEVRRLLSTGALHPISTPPPTSSAAGDGSWLEWMRTAAERFCTDTNVSGPSTWSEMTAFIEQYLKPYALAHMAGVADAANPDAVPASKVADTVKADRGTVIKQLRRFYETRRRDP